MNKCIWLIIFLGLGILTGCSQPEEVMTAIDGKNTVSDGQTEQNPYWDNTKTDIQVSPNDDSGTEAAMTDSENQGSESDNAKEGIYVYVCGYVEKPGVYRLSVDARICDALKLAGGVTKEGRPEALNQAEHVSDGQTLYVPGMDEEIEETVLKDDGLVDINQADKAALMTLPGIGESKAEIIIQYREEHGTFNSIEELMEIPGIKEGVFNKIKGSIKCR